jgi:hypothetical protein
VFEWTDGTHDQSRNLINAVFQLPNNNSLIPWSSEARSRSIAQKFSNIFWNPKFHYRAHKSALTIPILSQANPFRTTPSHFSTIHFNVVLSPTSKSSYW